MEKFKQWINEHREKTLFYGAMSLFICIVIFAAGLWRKEEPSEAEMSQLLASMAYSEEVHDSALLEMEETPSEKVMIYIDVKGAVQNPGVYKMKDGDRIQDVVREAGGFTSEADEASINLALKLTDQMMIYIPQAGEEERVTEPDRTTSGEGSGAVNINTADAPQLTSLNGIGEKKAEKIIQYREENGSFQTIEEIKEVSGIGEKTFEGLKDFITVE